jgi:hypothetical protein
MGHTMAHEIEEEQDEHEQQVGSGAGTASASSASPLSRVTGRALLPLLRGRMLRIVPSLIERVRPAEEVRHAVRQLRLHAAEQALASGADPVAAAAALSSSTSGPHAALRASLRAQRDALRARVASQHDALAQANGDLARARAELAAEADAWLATRQKSDLELQRRALREAFLARRKKDIHVWDEYTRRIRAQAMLLSPQQQQQQLLGSSGGGGAPHSQAQTFHSSGNAAKPGELLESASEHALRAVFKVVLDSFEATFAQAQRNANDQQQQQQLPSQPQPAYPQLTPEWCAAHAELRALFPAASASTFSSSPSSSSSPPSSPASICRFDGARFLRDLANEVERSMQRLERRREEVDAQNKEWATKQQAANGSTGNGSSALTPRSTFTAHNSSSSRDDSSSSFSQQPPPPLQTQLSDLISRLEEESATRFLQAQKLQNEAAAAELMLEELLHKQRGSDEEVLAPQLHGAFAKYSFEQQQHRQSLRRLQNLQGSIAALRAQLSFAQRTAASFERIASAREEAWADFETRKQRVEQFALVRKDNERSMVGMVMENKALRNKFAEYDGRAREFLASQLQPLCALLSRSATALVDSVAREDREGGAVVRSPFSSLEESVQRGGKGRVTLARLSMHQTAMPTLQQNQVHRLLADPCNSNSDEFKGMCHLLAHESAAVQLAPLVQRLVHQSLHEALVARHAATSFATLLPPGPRDQHPSLSVAGLDVASLHDWQQLEQRVRRQNEEQNGAALNDMVSSRQYRHRRLQLHSHCECPNKVVCLVSAISPSSLCMRCFVCAAVLSVVCCFSFRSIACPAMHVP